jgi:hypothetical protein
MKSRLAWLFAVVVGFLPVAATSARATTIRTGSNYGLLGGITTSSQDYSIGDETVVCTSTTDPSSTNPCTEWDLLLQINNAPTNPDLGQAIQITIPQFPTTGGVFGILNCNVLDTATGLYDSGAQSFGSLCTPNTNPAATNCDLSGVSPGQTDTFTLPAACIVAGETFFFDETSPELAAPSVAGSIATPEPGTLLLLVAGLFLLTFCSRQRVATRG